MEEELALSTPRIDLVLQYLQDRCTPLLCSFKKQIEQQHKSSFCLLNGNVAFFFWRAHHKLLILALINLHLTPVCIGVFASCQFLGLFLSLPLPPCAPYFWGQEEAAGKVAVARSQT